MNRGIEGAISKRHHAIFCDLSRFALDFSAFAGTSSALLFSSLLKIFQSLFLVLSFERALLLPFLLYFTLGCGIDNSFTISPLQGTWDTFLRFPLVSPLVVYVVVGCGVTHTHTHICHHPALCPKSIIEKGNRGTEEEEDDVVVAAGGGAVVPSPLFSLAVPFEMALVLSFYGNSLCNSLFPPSLLTFSEAFV